MKPRILILSAYHADSHAAWVATLTEQLPEFEWTILTLAPRYFSWRVRGNSLSWAFGDTRSQLQQPYDLVLATSMVDLSALRGFCPALSRVPTIVYFHENQFAYPRSGKEHNAVEPQILSIYTALCADQLLFNSQFNRQSFLLGARALLRKLPDQVPKDLVNQLEQRSAVLPVPIDLNGSGITARESLGGRPVRLVWSARWEFDKGPDRLLNLLDELSLQGVGFELALLGQSFRSTPDVFRQIADRYANQLVQFGYAQTREAYLNWLSWADIVLSTSLHEFQGLALLEAVSRGALPLVPDRQVYPELFGDQFVYESDLTHPAREARLAVAKLTELIAGIESGGLSPPEIERFSARALIPNYRALVESMLGRSD